MSSPIDSRERRSHALEIKFLVTHTVAQHVREWATDHLCPDPYGSGAQCDEYQTTSVYFDTSGLDVFHRRSSFGRAKYRVRRYGTHDFVFLERKLRTPVLLAKRRTSVPLDDLRLVGGSRHRDWVGSWFHERLKLRQLTPKCEVAYRRIARVSRNEHGLMRLTIDHGLSATVVSQLDFAERERLAFMSDHVIVELKYRVSMPALFKRLVERFALVPARISKYRLALSALASAQCVPDGLDGRAQESGGGGVILLESCSPDVGGARAVRPEF